MNTSDTNYNYNYNYNCKYKYKTSHPNPGQHSCNSSRLWKSVEMWKAFFC